MTQSTGPDEQLTVAFADGVARLRFTRPAARNALDVATCQLLLDALERFAKQANCRVVVIEGSSGVFASGADIAELARLSAAPPQLLAGYRLLRQTQERLFGMPQPTIAAIDGYCIGAGLSLAVACDLRVATPRSIFGAPPATLGLLYSDAEIARLMRLVGPAVTREWLFTGRRVNADEALSAGLLNQLTDNAQLDAALAPLLQKILAASSASVRALKQKILALELSATAVSVTDAAAEQAFFSADATEGFKAFSEHRKAEFPSNREPGAPSQEKERQ